jgi:predicted RecB family nuclease
MPIAPRRRLSPSRLNDFLGCEHRTYLDLLDARGELSAERLQPNAELLLERGRRHEAAILERLRARGLAVHELPQEGSVDDLAQATRTAMRAGHDVIYQACLADDEWVGYPDFLIRVETPSDIGEFSYEIHDAKVARHARPSHVFQLLFYDEQLQHLQGRAAERVHLILGGDTQLALSPADFQAYAARIRGRFLERRAQLDAPDPDPPVAYPYPVPGCEFCPWWKHCEGRRRDDDHLSLVADLSRRQGLKLERDGVATLPELALLPADRRIPRLAGGTLDGLRAQADLQRRSRGLPVPLYELLEPEHERGLARLPEPSPGDVFFDFEGDPFWGDDGLEYLFGSLAQEDGAWTYRPLWATSRTQERERFEAWMTWITERLDAHPDLHIFHYNSYEPTAVKRLMSRHGTMVHEVDELLRRKVFVDLFGVARQGVRIGTESYSLKALEPVFGFRRDAELRGAPGSMRRWQGYLDNGDTRLLDEIAAYNEDDCRSTLALRDWLMARRHEAEATFGVAIDALQPAPARQPSPRAVRYQEQLARARERLLSGLPDDELQFDDDHRARRLAFDLTGYHEREAKPKYWEHFARVERSVEELRDDDDTALADLTAVAGTERVDTGKSFEWTLTFPRQHHKQGKGPAFDPAADRGVQIVELDDGARTLVARRGHAGGHEPPRVLLPPLPIQTNAQVDALMRFADRLHDHGLGPCGHLDAATDLLVGRAPRLRAGTPPLAAGDLDRGVLVEQVAGLDRSVLVVQGPPGAGKTYTGAQLAVALLARGLRVGVMATSHKAISNLLAAIDAAAVRDGVELRGWKKPGQRPEDEFSSDRITSVKQPPRDVDLNLIAGTAWLWASQDRHECVDVLFVDEAGQVSLADAIAVSQGARSVVLLGDPQQLAHVSQGTHPHGSGASVLQHLLGERPTVPADRGVFLAESWRMHPDLCTFVSETMYEGRLHAHDGCAAQRIDSPGLHGTGLRLLAVDHEDNRQAVDEEAAAVAAQIERLLAGGSFVDAKGERRMLTLQDVLVVAPYNAQVRRLRAALPPGARVGTVDKFQGQQAPIVFFSMTSSSGEDIPRGMDFLLDSNRLNVAISRAQALAVVVCSPRLLTSECTTVEQMRLVNLLCRFADAAEPVAA